MHSLKSDWAQKKKKQALRRLSQSGQRGSSSSQFSSVRAASGAVRGRRGGRGGRGRGVGRSSTRPPPQAQQGNNPFLAAASLQSKRDNPFLDGSAKSAGSLSSRPSTSQSAPPTNPAQQNLTNPFLASRNAPSSAAPPPPSYASVVSGEPASNPPHVPVPSFITHGPASVQMQMTSEDTPHFDQQPQAMSNPFTYTAPARSDSSSTASLTASGLILGQPKLQVPSNTGLPNFLQPPFSTQGGPILAQPNLQGDNQTTFTTVSALQPGLQVQSTASAVPGSNSAAALPSNTSLHVKGIPAELNNGAFLEKHFSRFGPLKSIECNPQKRYATVTFQDKESAMNAKRGGKILSPKHGPVQLFWNSLPANKPGQAKPMTRAPPPPSKYVYVPGSKASTAPPPGDTGVKSAGDQGQQLPPREEWKGDGDYDSGLEDTAQTDSIHQEGGERSALTFTAMSRKPPLKRVVKKATGKVVAKVGTGKSIVQPAKKSIWDRLGGKVGETSGKGKSKSGQEDQEWKPEGDEGGRGEGEEEETSHDPIMPRELADLGLKTTGDEMDTVARYVEHGYYLRSLDQSGAYPGPKGEPVTKPAVQLQLPQRQITVPPPRITTGVDSRQVYDIPTPRLPPPPRPKGASANDHYESLDARDQDIRKAMVKKTSLTDSKSVVGTCPDMCPEKERYRREDTRRLSWFEVNRDIYEPRNAKVDHSKAIKEYSGSAADKEEPLPHELRPIGVLKMTMDYLVTMVMDDCHDRPADWYDFVWNRTRAIRKDITLQHLNSYECVELTEKCARFHILCAYLQCEEDIMDFDPRLNNENLNKCLLSLKEFYRDLRHQKGVVCPNEAEFCGYDILLHLTDGDVLNLVEKYSPGVRQQPAVRFAVEVALSLDSNNFVRFFKMARTATFLSACIMHRYFTLVRTSALRCINRAHSVVRKPTSFPLSSLARMLAFQDNQKAGEFCSEFQLVVGEEAVEFVRQALPDPPEAIPLRKCPHLVDSKNTQRLGEVVNGGPLPSPPLHTPYSSFSAKAQLRSREPSPCPQAPPIAPPPQAQQMGYSVMDMAAVVNDIVDEVNQTDLRDILKQTIHEMEEVELREQSYLWLCTSLIDSLLLEESRGIAVLTLLEEMEADKVRRELSTGLLEGVLQEVTESEIAMVVTETYRECVLEAEAQAAATLSVASTLLDEGVVECVKAMVENALSEAWKEKMDLLEERRVQFERKQLNKYWSRWRHILSVRQHLHKCVAAIPPLPPLVTLPCQLEALLPDEKRRRVESMSLSQSMVAQLLEERREDEERRRREFCSPLDLPSLLLEPLLVSRFHGSIISSQHRSIKDVFWKLVFVTPAQNNLSGNDTDIVDWLSHKLHYEQTGHTTPPSVGGANSQLLSLSATPLTSSTRVVSRGGASVGEVTARTTAASRQQGQLCLAVRGVSDEMLLSRYEDCLKNLLGTCAIAVFLPTPQHSNRSVEGVVGNILEIVEQVLGEKSFPPVPLLIICSSELEKEFLAFWLEIRRVLAEAKPSCISVINYLQVDLSTSDSSQHSQKQLVQELRQLAECSPPQPHLFHLPVRDYVEQGLLKHFVSPVISDGGARQKAHLPSQPPAPIVTLYNAVLHHSIITAISEEVRTLNWPVVEFSSSQEFSHGAPPPLHWNDDGYLASTKECLTALMLPSPPFLPPSASWSEQCALCLDYVRSISLPTGDAMAHIPLISRVKTLLHHAEASSDLFVPWDHVILICAESMVAYLNSDLWVSGFYGDESEEVFVVPSEWVEAQARTSLATVDRVVSKNTPGSLRKRRRHRSDPPTVDVSSPLLHHQNPQLSLSVGVSPASVAAAPVDVSGYSALEEEVRTKLESSLKKEKALSRSFEAQLQQWLSPTGASEPARKNSKSSAKSRHSSGLERRQLARRESDDRSNGEASIRQGLKQLKKKIRLAKYLDTKDNILLYNLANPPLDFQTPPHT